jgi:ketosteroid isomerase-like protein
MTEEVRVTGDWAFGWGTDVLTLTPLAGGHAFQVRGRVMSIMRRHANGGWKFARAISNFSSE